MEESMSDIKDIIPTLNDDDIKELVDSLTIEQLPVFEKALLKKKAETRSELFNVGDEIYLMKGDKPYIFCGKVQIMDKEGVLTEQAMIQEKNADEKGVRKTTTREFDRIQTKEEMNK